MQAHRFGAAVCRSLEGTPTGPLRLTAFWPRGTSRSEAPTAADPPAASSGRRHDAGFDQLEPCEQRGDRLPGYADDTETPPRIVAVDRGHQRWVDAGTIPSAR